MSKTGNILAGIITGAALGLTIGVLYAPDKGSKTRKKVKKTALDQKDILAGKAGEMKDQVSATLKTKKAGFEKDMDKIVTKMSSKADNVISSLESKLEQLRKANERMGDKASSNLANAHDTVDATTAKAKAKLS